MDEIPVMKAVLLRSTRANVRSAAYLIAVYGNCFLDSVLSILTMSVQGIFQALNAPLKIAPVTKFLYTSDAHTVPHAYNLVARWVRRVLAADKMVSFQAEEVTVSDGKASVRRNLAEKATRLYRCPVQASQIRFIIVFLLGHFHRILYHGFGIDVCSSSKGLQFGCGSMIFLACCKAYTGTQSSKPLVY